MKRMGKGAMIETLQDQGFSRAEAELAVGTLMTALRGCLQRGGAVSLPHIAVLRLAASPERRGVHPQTREVQVFPAGVRLKVTRSPNLTLRAPRRG